MFRETTIMRLWSVFCIIHLAVNVILGESPPGLRGFQDGRYKEENFNPQIQGSKYFNFESEDDGEDDKTSDEETASRRVIDPEVVDQLEGNGWLDVIPGHPGRDYPNYEKIPETSFNCNGKTAGGYYADIEARCQVFHVCSTEGQKISFLCPSGSIFNQKYFVCDWWYDFECDDASDLYSLNDKINRGGTGSGPSGPGNIVGVDDETEYRSNGENFHQTNQDNGNYVSADGFDLSLAGTGEGGPGYARNIDNNNNNNKGYQGYEEKDNDRRSANNADKNESMPKTDQGLINKRREQEAGISAVSDSRGNSREHSRKQNTTPATDGNTRVNHQTGYANADSNSNSPIKSDHFLNGRAELGNDKRADNYNQGSRNKDDNDRPQRRNEKTRGQEEGNGFRERSSVFMEEKKNDGAEFTRLGNNKNEYESSSTVNAGESAAGRRANTRGRQRAREGLQRGLGNGYPSLVASDAGESPTGSDDIAVGVIPLTGELYEAGNQRSVNSQEKTSRRSEPTSTDYGSRSPGQITDLRTENDSQRVGINYQNERVKRPDFREDNYFPQDLRVKEDNFDRDSTRYKHPNNRENDNNNNQNNQSSRNNYGNDYLVGIVPENRDSGNWTAAGFNQSRRFLPIL